jgi:hypothetical protein
MRNRSHHDLLNLCITAVFYFIRVKATALEYPTIRENIQQQQSLGSLIKQFTDESEAQGKYY